jgi:hypothetical protein
LDESELERLSEHGLAALLPSERLRAVAEYCWDKGETTGDARYCSLWRTISYVVEVFEEFGAMEAPTFKSVDYAFRRHLRAVLRASTVEEGALLARSFREEIQARLRNDHLDSADE